MEKITNMTSDDICSSEFSEKFNKNIEAREMDIITTLNFDFSVNNPRDMAFEYIERSLSWHYPLNLREISYFIETDCFVYINKLLSEFLLF